MSQHQPVFVEQPVASDWEVEEHLFCCNHTQALCGEHFDVRVELTESFSDEPVECRLCYAVQQGDDVTWNCPYCGCGVDDDCGCHL